MKRPEPSFEAPWHAQLFALTVTLNEAGHFDWKDWATAFSQTLKEHGLAKELNGGDDYFNAWLATIERFLGEKGLAEAEEITKLKAAWEAAYLATPHGEQVRF